MSKVKVLESRIHIQDFLSSKNLVDFQKQAFTYWAKKTWMTPSQWEEKYNKFINGELEV